MTSPQPGPQPQAPAPNDASAAARHGGVRSALLLEDYPSTVAFIRNTLLPHGVQVVAVANRDELLQAIRQGEHDLVLLDLTLPDDDGLDIAKAIRGFSGIPIIMVTGRTGSENRITGLDSGADDYIEKPFAPGELVARVHSLLRRTNGRVLTERSTRHLQLGTARLDIRTGQLAGGAGSQQLSAEETAVLIALARAGGPLSRTVLVREAFGRAWRADDRSLDAHLAQLQRRFQQCTGLDDLIVADDAAGLRLTVRAGIGP